MHTETFAVEQSLPGERLDKFLCGKYPAASRATLKRLIEEGHVRVNGQAVKPSHAPRAGERIEIDWPDPKPAGIQPVAMPLDVLFEDDSLLVLNKPAGLIVHPAEGYDELTLVHGLMHHCAGQLSGIGGVARPGVVHRLDKETSGCLVVAKNDQAHLGLSRQFAQRTVRKIYHAIVCGALADAEGEIRAPIARHPSHRRKRMVVRAGDMTSRSAHTRWRILERLAAATYLETQIFTGRTHQIRVHFQFLGHPLVGDDVYGRKENREIARQTGFAPPRMLLHARELGFKHPRTGQEMTFQAPLPEDFRQALQFLRTAESSGGGR